MNQVNLTQTLDNKNKKMQVKVQVVTLDDNLEHPYFSSIDLAKDNVSPVGVAKLMSVYDKQILDYWTNYIGIVVLSFDMTETHHINTNDAPFFKQYGLPQRLQNTKYNYSFICKVSKIKPKGKQIIIYLEDLGWKFLQKVPQEFRDAYIAGQPLDKAFQAICEFLGVEFAYSIEDLQEYNFGADGYSVEKEGQVIETVETILSEWKNSENETTEDSILDNAIAEVSNLIDFDKNNKNNKNYVKNKQQQNNNIQQKTKNEEQLEELTEEFNQKIIDLFIGNTFYESELIENVMHYDYITVTPSGNNTTNNISQINTDNQQNNNTTNNQEPSSNDHHRKALNMTEIRSLTVSEATEKAKQTKVYDNKTLKRLRRRALGAYW